jgi:transposase
VDVSSQVLDARIGADGPHRQVKRTAEGIEVLRRFCEEHGVELVVMEATGGLERLPFGQLSAGGMACAIVNPRQVRRYAEAMGYLEKTDRIDAGMIAGFAQAKGVQAQQPPCADQQRLTALVVRLRQLTAAKVVQENQRRLVDDPEVLASFEAVLKVVKAQIRSLEQRIAELIHADPLWGKLDEAFREIKGVADRTVANLIAELPEIGTLTGKESGKLAGVAPLAQDSGKHSGRRAVRGGRAPVRSILYVVASVVARYEPDFIAFRKRLLDAGKPRKVVRIAVARKLLVRLNAKARDVRNSLAQPIAA